ncbi:hypothetical protein [Sphingorhabdus sp. Alg231-15]|uniref:hypothetical protein n=1 Tax=Sphingorhabdus sp. Alg231-15 TaxID=1922222 RepID=UPI000D560FAF
MKKIMGVLVLASFSQALAAQAIKSEPPLEAFSDEQISDVEYPDLQFEETEGDIKVYDKYFFFHRAETNFDVAFGDINECDALARGAGYYRSNVSYYSPQAGVLGSAAGSIIGSMVADAIFGSAERRRIRRVNLRNCMAFKGYERYGLEKERWQKFHFEEGFGEANAVKRRSYFMVQAKVASGPKPAGMVLEK